MTVLGFQEAIDTAQRVEIGEGLLVPVVSIPAFVLLKLMAWRDRRTIKNTDASDLLFVLRNYFHAGNEERVYDEALDLLEACDFKVEIACAGLLARDARDVALAGTRDAVRALLQSGIPTPRCTPTCSREPHPCCLASSSTIPMGCSPHLPRSS